MDMRIDNSSKKEIASYSPKKEHAHRGHRERMRARFLKTGLSGFAPHEMLEFLLFFSQPRINTNEIAHSLIETFGSLSGVFDASYEELMNVKHIGPKTAILLTLFPKLFREYSLDKEMQKVKMENIAQVLRFSRSLFIGDSVESLYLILFDNSMRMLDCHLLYHGTINGVPVMPRRIAERALEKHASYVVLAHNHPDGIPVPSRDDLNMTDEVVHALKLFEIPLLEHILVTDAKTVPLVLKYRSLKRPTITHLTEDFLEKFYEGTEV